MLPASSNSGSKPLILTSAVFLSFYLLYKLLIPRSKKTTDQDQQIKKILTSQQIEIIKAIDHLYKEEREESASTVSSPLPLITPTSIENPFSLQLSNIEFNQKIKDKIELLGDYINCQEKEYDGNYTIHLKDSAVLKNKLSAMKEDGIQELQIVSDFDQTTTCFHINGKACNSLFSCFRQTNLTSQSFKNTTLNLCHFYHPLESDPKIEINLRRLLVKQWYSALKSVFLQERLSKKKCLGALNDGNFGMRYGYREFLNICKVFSIPFYMISGGFTEMIQTMIAKVVDINNYPNFFTFSNDMIFDKEENLVDIHMKVSSISKNDFFAKKKLSFKRNTLLFGDLLTDYDVASHFSSKNLIAIAFLQEENKEFLNDYLEKFDVVVMGDGDFLLPDRILRFVAGIDENPFFKEKFMKNDEFVSLQTLFQ